MCEIKIRLIKLIALLEFLVYIENRGVYQKILKMYLKVWMNIENKMETDFSPEDFKPLENVTRLFFEAIPSDDKLSDYLVEKMQDFYEMQKEVK